MSKALIVSTNRPGLHEDTQSMQQLDAILIELIVIKAADQVHRRLRLLRLKPVREKGVAFASSTLSSKHTLSGNYLRVIH